MLFDWKNHVHNILTPIYSTNFRYYLLTESSWKVWNTENLFTKQFSGYLLTGVVLGGENLNYTILSTCCVETIPFSLIIVSHFCKAMSKSLVKRSVVPGTWSTGKMATPVRTICWWWGGGGGMLPALRSRVNLKSWENVGNELIKSTTGAFSRRATRMTAPSMKSCTCFSSMPSALRDLRSTC